MLLRGRDIPCPWLCKIWPWKPFMNTNAFHAHKHTYIHACLSAWSMPRDISTRIVHELWAFPGEGESRPNHRKWDRCWTSGGQRKTLSYVTVIRGIRVFRRDDVIGKGATVGGRGIWLCCIGVECCWSCGGSLWLGVGWGWMLLLLLPTEARDGWRNLTSPLATERFKRRMPCPYWYILCAIAILELRISFVYMIIDCDMG